MRARDSQVAPLLALVAVIGGSACIGSIGSGTSARAVADGGGASEDGGTAPSADGSPVTSDAQAPSSPSPDAGGNAVDAARPRDGGWTPAACTSLGTSDWPTYAHDAQRTSASDGCMIGPLTLSWTYGPSAPSGGTLQSVAHAIATGAAVYVKYANANNGAQVAAAVDKLSLDGKRAWQWTFGDFEEHHWATFAFGSLWVEEDSMWHIDDSTGQGQQLGEYDDWGANTADATRFYVSSDVNSKDGYGIYVGAYPAHPTPVFPPPEWHADLWGNGNQMGTECGFEVNDSLAVDQGVVYQAGEYRNLSGSPPFPSGVRSFDGSTGSAGWAQQTLPRSAVSASSGLVFLVEQDADLALVARSEKDGSIVWSKAMAAAPSVQAPVLAAGLVIVAEAMGIDAYDAASGALVWSVPGIDAVQTPFTETLNTYFDACGGADAVSTLADTSLAVATGSNTLVVTATDGVHIVSLEDGSTVWKGKVAGTAGPLENPVIVGKTLYAVDTAAAAGAGALVALQSP